jgi:hypothetical protein
MSEASATRPTVLVSIPMDRCVKNFLDTRLFTALRARFDVCIVSYLADDAGFRRTYGGEGVSFLSAPRFLSRLRERIYNLAEIARFHGFYFRHRHDVARVHWRAATLYRYPEDYGPGKDARPRRLRYLAFNLVAGLGGLLRLDRVLAKLLGGWYFAQPALESWMRSRKPVAYIATAHRTDQEKFVAHHAARFGVRSILLPDSWDNFIVDGYQFHEFDLYGVMGPVMARQLERIHDVQAARQRALGVPVRRMYEEVLANGSYDLHARFSISPATPIVTYIAVSTMACYDTVEIIERLARSIDQGELPPAVILVRTQPGQDPAEYFRRLGSHPAVRIQVAGSRGGGGEGRVDFDRRDENLEYAATIARASVVVSNLSACVVDGCAADVPTIMNAVELSAYPPGGFSPRALVDLDPFELLETGLPVARSMPELIAAVAGALRDPAASAASRRRAAQASDYGTRDYVERFLEMVTGEARSAA